MSTAVIIIIVIAIILLIVQTVLSSMAAAEVRKGQSATVAADATVAFNKAHLYSTAAAVTAAMCIVGLVIAMIVYIHSQRILTAAHARLGQVVSAYGVAPQVGAAVNEARVASGAPQLVVR